MKKILILLLLGVNSLLSLAIPQVYPNILEVTLNKKIIYDEITVSNPEDGIKKYKIELSKENDKYDLSPYISFFPKIIEIEPNKQKKIRIAIKNYPYDKVMDGEVRALLKISEIESKTKTKYKRKDENGEEFSTNIDILFNIAMMIYGKKGEMKEKVSLTKIKVADKLNLSIKNEGNVSFIPIVEVLSNGKKEEIKIPKLLRGGVREVQLDLKKYDKGSKVTIYNSKGKKILEK